MPAHPVRTNAGNHNSIPSQTNPESIPDEDPLEGVVTDPSVLAEVTLAIKPSKSS
jgi:hypothetical protein